MLPIFSELAAGLLLATIFGYIARLLKQPLIIAYITAGIVVSLLGLARFSEEVTLHVFSQIGIALLLFLVGLELKISELRQVGKAAILTGVGEILTILVLGFALVSLTGIATQGAFFVALALTFSSTIIIVKLLLERQEINSLHGRILVGVLLVEDFAAIIALMLLSGYANGLGPSFSNILMIFVKGAGLFALAYILNRTVLPELFKRLASSQELLFISALTWCFIFASASVLMGFSIEMGAFVAGVALASSPYQVAIAAKIHPLRDFFVVIFFLVLGLSLDLRNIESIWPMALVFSSFVLIVKPIVIITILGVLGFRKRTAFLAGITIPQISEFSLILLAAARQLAIVDEQVVSMMTLTAIITIAVSSYLVYNSSTLYEILSPILKYFERSHSLVGSAHPHRDLSRHTVLFGCEQMGRDVINLMGKRINRPDFVIVDFNPKVVEQLTADGYTALYGDMTDPELLSELQLGEAKVIISTVPYIDSNLRLIHVARVKGFKGPLVVTTYWADDGIRLYEAGADYVVIPEFTAGKHVARVLDDHWTNLESLSKLRSRHMAELISSL